MAGIVLCGEGNSDLQYVEGANTEPPLKVCIDKILDYLYAKSPYIEYKPVTRSELHLANKGKPEKKTAVVRGLKKQNPNAQYEYNCAKALTQKAREFANDEGMEERDWGAILFKDLDAPTGTDIDKKYNAVIAAIDRGFADANFKTGIPMIPKTRSESWILCALNPQEAVSRNNYEDLPMSDKGKGNGKELLASKLGVSESETYKVLQDRLDSLQWTEIQAQSFKYFVERLRTMSESITGMKTVN